MPRITRKRTTAFATPSLRFAGGVLGGAGLLALGAILFGMSDTGTIDVAGKINGTDQSGFATKVNATNNVAGINGGLQPVSAEDAIATPEPEPTPETPVDTIATTTEADSATTTQPDSGSILEPVNQTNGQETVENEVLDAESVQ